MTKTRTDKADSMNAARKTSARRASNFDAAVIEVLDSLGHVADDGHAARHLRDAFDCVLQHAPAPTRPITPDERDRILWRVCVVRAGIPAVFPYPMSMLRLSAARGFDALEALVMSWAETSARRAFRHPHFMPDALAQARMYRNELDNAALAAEVCDRYDERRAADGRKTKIALAMRKMTGTAYGHR